MSNNPVQTVGASGDKVKVTLAALAVIAGVVGFYVLAGQQTLIRAAALVGGLVVAVLLMWTAEAGRNFVAFAREAVRETRKVVWPGRKEAMQMTGIVFAFVIVMAIFLWGADKVLEMVLYGLILDWK